MQRYFFHIWSNGHGRSYDELGLNFPSTEAACREALRAAQDLISVFAARGQDPRDHAIEIENEAGEVVLRGLIETAGLSICCASEQRIDEWFSSVSVRDDLVTRYTRTLSTAAMAREAS